MWNSSTMRTTWSFTAASPIQREVNLRRNSRERMNGDYWLMSAFIKVLGPWLFNAWFIPIGGDGSINFWKYNSVHWLISIFPIKIAICGTPILHFQTYPHFPHIDEHKQDLDGEGAPCWRHQCSLALQQKIRDLHRLEVDINTQYIHTKYPYTNSYANIAMNQLYFTTHEYHGEHGI